MGVPTPVLLHRDGRQITGIDIVTEKREGDCKIWHLDIVISEALKK